MPHLEGPSTVRRRRRRDPLPRIPAPKVPGLGPQVPVAPPPEPFGLARAADDEAHRFHQSPGVRRKIIRDRLTREAAARTPAARAELERKTRERAEFVGPPEPSGRERTAGEAFPELFARIDRDRRREAAGTPADRRRVRQERRAAKDAEMAQNLQDRDRKRADAQARKTERRNRIRARLGLPPLPVPGGGLSVGIPQPFRGAEAPIEIESTETFDRRTVRPGEFVRTPDGQVSRFIRNQAGDETFVPFTTGPTGALIPDVDQIDFPAFEQTLPFHERRDLGALAIDSGTDFGTRIRGVHRERNAIIDAIDLTGTMTEAQAVGPRAELDRREAQILFEFVRSGAAKRAQRHPPGQGLGDIWTDHGVLLTRTEQGIKKLDRVDGGEENLKLAKQAYKDAKAKLLVEGQEPTMEQIQQEIIRLQAVGAMTQRVVESMQEPGAGQDPGLPSLPGRTLPIGQRRVGEVFIDAPVTQEEYDSLDVGTRYYHPDGSVRTKR